MAYDAGEGRAQTNEERSLPLPNKTTDYVGEVQGFAGLFGADAGGAPGVPPGPAHVHVDTSGQFTLRDPRHRYHEGFHQCQPIGRRADARWRDVGTLMLAPQKGL
jgi:hypothetical protein